MEKILFILILKQDCGISLSSNSENLGGCFPLDDQIFCKACNIQRIRNLTNIQTIYNPYIKLPMSNQSSFNETFSANIDFQN